MSKNGGSVMVWGGSIRRCPLQESLMEEEQEVDEYDVMVEGERALNVDLWSAQPKNHPLAKMLVRKMEFRGIVDMRKIPLYMVSGGAYRVKSEDKYTQRFFDMMVNKTDLSVGLVAAVEENISVARSWNELAGYMLFYLEFVQVDHRTEAQLFAVYLTEAPFWRELEGLQNQPLEKEEPAVKEERVERDERADVLQEIHNEADVPIKQEETDPTVMPAAAKAAIKESAFDKLQRRRSSVTPFALAAQKSFVASGKENIYVKPKLERRYSVMDSQSAVSKRSASRESSVVSDSMSEIEKRNLAVIQRVILSELRLRGISREHHEYKHLYHHAYKATCFALRRKLACTSSIRLEEIQDKVDKLVSMFLETSTAEDLPRKELQLSTS